jgi:hypothetical protein
MAVMLIRRMDSIVMPGSRSLGLDRSGRTTRIDPPYRFMTGCTVQRSATRSVGGLGNGCLPSGGEVGVEPMKLLKMINGKVVPTKAVAQGLAEAESWGISCRERARSFKDQSTWKGIGSNPLIRAMTSRQFQNLSSPVLPQSRKDRPRVAPLPPAWPSHQRRRRHGLHHWP